MLGGFFLLKCYRLVFLRFSRKLQPDLSILCCRFLATGNSYRSIAKSFRVGISPVSPIVPAVVSVIWDCLVELYTLYSLYFMFGEVSFNFWRWSVWLQSDGRKGEWSLSDKLWRLKETPKSVWGYFYVILSLWVSSSWDVNGSVFVPERDRVCLLLWVNQSNFIYIAPFIQTSSKYSK